MPDSKEFINATIDRIHSLVEQSAILRKQGYDFEAKLLIEEAEDHADELRACETA